MLQLSNMFRILLRISILYYIYSYFYPCQCSFLSEVSSVFLLFPFHWESFSSHSLRVDMRVTNSHGFHSSENVFISPSFMKDIFTEYRILNWQFFSFSTWKMLWHFLMASMISHKKFAVIQMSNLSNMPILFPVSC